MSPGDAMHAIETSQPASDEPWSPTYWRRAVHGAAWERVRPRLAREWAMADVGRASWDEAELALRFGVGARHEYVHESPVWDPILEATLSGEWSQSHTGRTFEEVKQWVRHGWDFEEISEHDD